VRTGRGWAPRLQEPWEPFVVLHPRVVIQGKNQSGPVRPQVRPGFRGNLRDDEGCRRQPPSGPYLLPSRSPYLIRRHPSPSQQTTTVSATTTGFLCLPLHGDPPGSRCGASPSWVISLVQPLSTTISGKTAGRASFGGGNGLAWKPPGYTVSHRPALTGR
jgi:hypothetical protein